MTGDAFRRAQEAWLQPPDPITWDCPNCGTEEIDEDECPSCALTLAELREPDPDDERDRMLDDKYERETHE